jgi:hypothetical protein
MKPGLHVVEKYKHKIRVNVKITPMLFYANNVEGTREHKLYLSA